MREKSWTTTHPLLSLNWVEEKVVQNQFKFKIHTLKSPPCWACHSSKFKNDFCENASKICKITHVRVRILQNVKHDSVEPHPHNKGVFQSGRFRHLAAKIQTQTAEISQNDQKLKQISNWKVQKINMQNNQIVMFLRKYMLHLSKHCSPKANCK